MIHVSLNPSALLIFKDSPSLSPHFCCDQLSKTLFSVPVQPERGSLLQIESSLPACAAKQLSTALQAIIAALSHSESRLDFHYNASCHSCFSFGELGLLEKLELVTVSSPPKNTTNTSFITLYWFQNMSVCINFQGQRLHGQGETVLTWELQRNSCMSIKSMVCVGSGGLEQGWGGRTLSLMFWLHTGGFGIDC